MNVDKIKTRAEMLTDKELQSLRNMGNECEAAADELERLRAALDHVARVALGSRTANKRAVWIAARAMSALNHDEAWRDVEKPRGYHDALERPNVGAKA